MFLLCCKLDFLQDLFSMFVTVVGFILTIKQLVKSNKEKSISNVIALKNEMRSYDNIHLKLLPNGEWDNLDENYFLGQECNVENFGNLVSYLGLFEVAFEMIQTGILKEEQFKTFFNYRFNNIFSNQAVANYILSDRENWGKLIQLFSKLNNEQL